VYLYKQDGTKSLNYIYFVLLILQKQAPGTTLYKLLSTMNTCFQGQGHLLCLVRYCKSEFIYNKLIFCKK